MATRASAAIFRRRRHRRRYRKYALSRSATFGPGLLAPLAGWLYLGEPLRWAGLAALVLAGLLVVPVAVVWVLFCLPAIVIGGPFREWRIQHRKHHDRAQCKSAVITAGLRRVTFAMDRYRCLYCGITAAELAALPPRVGKDGKTRPRCLHPDHRKPWKIGGRTTLFNMGLLCDEHNEIKCNYWRERNGYVWYRYRDNPELTALAAEITRVVIYRSRNPLRLWRAAWALGA
jgi:hypothetical protein